MWESEYFEFHSEYLDFPRRMVTPKPVPGPAPAVLDGGDVRRRRGRRRARSASACCRSRSCSRSRRWPSRSTQYRAAATTPNPITRVTTNKVAAYTLVHCAETMAHARPTASGSRCGGGTSNLAEFTLEWEFPHLPQEERDAIFPLLNPIIEGDFDPSRSSATPT